MSITLITDLCANLTVKKNFFGHLTKSFVEYNRIFKFGNQLLHLLAV